VQPARQAEKPDQHPAWQSELAVSQRALQSLHCVASQASQVAAGLKLQPVAALQVSVVQLIASLQTSGAPLVHAPPTQRSSVVHALASAHAVPSGFGASTQAPVEGSQLALMQVPEAVQTTGLLPRQAPDWQESLRVHAFWSSQAEPFGFAGWLQTPVVGLHTPATRHASVAVQTTGEPPTQTPA
jgi:hypothetical protein